MWKVLYELYVDDVERLIMSKDWTGKFKWSLKKTIMYDSEKEILEVFRKFWGEICSEGSFTYIVCLSKMGKYWHFVFYCFKATSAVIRIESGLSSEITWYCLKDHTIGASYQTQDSCTEGKCPTSWYSAFSSRKIRNFKSSC